jgi:Late embryogenesis abundant protein.
MKFMKGKLASFVAMLMLACVLCSCGASKMKDIRITSCGLDSYSLKGFRAVDALVVVGIDNPSVSFTLSDVSGVVRYNGRNFASYTAESITVDKKCSKVYDLPCTAVLSDGVGLKDLLAIANQGSLEGFTTDVEVKVTLKRGVSKIMRFKNLDLNEMTK